MAPRLAPLRAHLGEISDAHLLRFDGAGHGLVREDWETVARAILDHTAAAPPP